LISTPSEIAPGGFQSKRAKFPERAGGKMFKNVVFHGTLNERTGYGIHASRFTEQLSKLIPVSINGEEGEVHVSLLDVVTAAHTTIRHPAPSILYTVWESTEYPAEFLDKLKLYDQLWVPSEWQRAASIAQGIPEEFVKVVPEGVDPEIYKPEGAGIDEVRREFHFSFVNVGQWQPRKSTLEICQSFIKAFPRNNKVRLYLSADTLFPSDTYKSTEERLAAYGLNDPRIIPVHFEEREAYIRRLQSSHCFVSCSRSEGWGLPMCESMACGIPTIVADFGGSTEYAGDAIVIPIRELKKPEGIYGNWDVPGKWGEPDYDCLVAQMKDVYKNYPTHKSKALATSETIRTKFSWKAAAEKAYAILEELSQGLSQSPVQISPTICNPADTEKAIRLYASQHNYEITSLRPRKAIFEVECWPNTQEKMDTLQETIKQIHSYGYPVLVSSHYPLPAEVIAQTDFYLYDKRDIMSGDDKPIYWRKKLDGTIEHKQCNVEYQGVAALNCFRNSIDFCRGKFDWIYQMNADMEVDLAKWLELVLASDKPMVCIPYEGRKDGIGGGLWAGRTEVLDRVIPYLDSWKQYADMFPDERFVVERWQYNYIAKYHDINEVGWIDIETINRFDNVDRNVWPDDEFQCHFIDGPFLNIVGISNREYDVEFNDGTDDVYTLKQKSGMWSKPSKKYYLPWTITAKLNGEVKFQYALSLKDKRVLISMGSKALGDTIAWIPYVDEFRKKHECKVVCSTWWKDIFDYPEIEFVDPGSQLENIYATYEIGCFDGQLDKNVTDWRLTTLQQVSSDILGLEYKPIKAKLKYTPAIPPIKPYVCFSEFSTMDNKLWNRPGAWQKIIDYLNSLGYDCVSVSVESTTLNNVIRHNGQSIEQTLTDISGASFYVGLNHGPAWLAYSLGIPCVMITGVSEEWNDFPNPYRISVDTGCKPCFNNPAIPIDRGREWCVNEHRYICTEKITEAMVKKIINKIINKGKKRKESSHFAMKGKRT
jgi:autotransporter strand-loop-strand O-heptosyltransferase